MLDRILSVFVAVGLALLLWLYARSRDQEILDNVAIPVQINLSPSQADQYNLETHGDGRVLVSFSAPPPRIRELRGMLQRNELHVELTYAIPEERLSEARYSDTILVEASDIHPPPGITAIMVEGRNKMPITINRLVERLLPVRFESDRAEPVGRVTLDPPAVLVRGPQEVMERAKFISTVPSALPARPANAPPDAAVSGRVALLQELEGRPVRPTPSRIMVRAQARRLYELNDVPIHFLCPPGFLLRPQFLDDRSGRFQLRLWGPVQDESPRIYAFVDLTKRSVSGPGSITSHCNCNCRRTSAWTRSRCASRRLNCCRPTSSRASVSMRCRDHDGERRGVSPPVTSYARHRRADAAPLAALVNARCTSRTKSAPCLRRWFP